MAETPEEIRSSVRERFARVARDPDKEDRFAVGIASAKSVGYRAAEIDGLPGTVAESFSGVGNPHSLGEYGQGEIVLDVGVGAGLDSLIAARQVGASGKVIGIDITPQMVQKARRNAMLAGVTNAHFFEAEAEHLPLPNDSVDVTITNGVLNLCFNKPKVLREILRVLRPGGRLQMADILLEDHVTPEELARKGAWSD